MSAPADDELIRLRAEVATLQARLDVRARRVNVLNVARRALAALTAMVAAWCTVCAVVALWLAGTSMDTDRWVRAVASLPSDPRVSAAVAEYTTTEVFALLDVEARLREALPDRAAFVAGPLTGQLRSYVRTSVDRVVSSDRFQVLWVEANRRAHQAAMTILEGRSRVVTAAGQYVTVDLLPLINEVLRDLEAALPSLFGRRLNLPDLSSGEIPPNLRVRIESAVGVALPENFAQFKVYDAGRLRELQAALVWFKRSVVAICVCAVVLFGLALAVSPVRRRTTLQFGVWLVIGVLAMTASLRAIRGDLVSRVPFGVYRDGVDAAVTTVFAGLRDRGVQLLWFGALLALLCYLVGPGRLPTWLRRTVRAAGTRGAAAFRRVVRRDSALRVAGWTGRHLDALRIAGVVVAGLVSLLLSSWTGLIVVAVLLAAYQVVLTAAARMRVPADPMPAGRPG